MVIKICQVPKLGKKEEAIVPSNSIGFVAYNNEVQGVAQGVAQQVNIEAEKLQKYILEKVSDPSLSRTYKGAGGGLEFYAATGEAGNGAFKKYIMVTKTLSQNDAITPIAVTLRIFDNQNEFKLAKEILYDYGKTGLISDKTDAVRIRIGVPFGDPNNKSPMVFLTGKNVDPSNGEAVYYPSAGAKIQILQSNDKVLKYLKEANNFLRKNDLVHDK